MAQVTVETARRIDFLIDYLLEAWRELPANANEMDEWDLIEQIDYIEEWTPKEDLFRELQRYVQRNELNAEQQARYDDLLAVKAANQRILEQLRAG